MEPKVPVNRSGITTSAKQTSTAEISSATSSPGVARLEIVGVGGWLMLFALICLQFAWSTSATFDEPGLIHSGYANLSAGATKSSTGNLLFAQTWSALPLLATRPVLPTPAEIEAVEPVNREFGRLFLYHPNNDWRAILRPARVMTIVLGVALGLLVFATARRCFGAAAAQVSLGFYCLSPVVLSNSSLATTDLAAALWFTVAVTRWWALLHRVTLPNVILCGIAMGLLLVTKFSSFAVAPIALVLAIIRLLGRKPLAAAWPGGRGSESMAGARQLQWVLGAAVGVCIVAAVTIWLSYLPLLTVFADRNATPVPWDRLPQSGIVEKVAVFLNRMHLLPEPYLVDLWVFGNSAGGRRAFLLGEYSVRGWWYFFPVAWWLKTPLPFLLALALAGVALVRARARWYALAPLATLLAGYSAVALLTTLNIGVRHLLPAYPAMFVLAGGVMLLPWRKTIRLGAVATLLVWSAIELWPVRTDLLAYFNAFAGGPREGHRVLVDSSYEWGQDLPAVENWLAARARRPGPKPPVYFSYFGNADLRRFALDAVLLPQFFDLRPVRRYELTAGTYLISATMLQSVYGPLFGPWRASYENLYRQLLPGMQGIVPAGPLTDEARARIQLFDALRFGRLCAYLRHRIPDARVSPGILVFELGERDLDAALRQPLPESDRAYHVPGTEEVPQSGLEFLK